MQVKCLKKDQLTVLSKVC